jgi:hypothetical protein
VKWKTANIGDKRERSIFALFPIDCEDGITRWLCRVRVVEEYNYYGGGGFEVPDLCWVVKEAYPASRTEV